MWTSSVACETILGWVLSGPLSNEDSFSSCLTTNSVRCSIKRSLEENDNLKQKLSLFWEIENVNPFDECVINQLEKDIVFNGDRRHETSY